MATTTTDSHPWLSAASSQWTLDSPPDATLSTPGKSLEDMARIGNIPEDVEKAPGGRGPWRDEDGKYLVEFDNQNDPTNPRNWAQSERWAITVSMGLLVFTVTFASSVFSVNIGVIQEKFNVTMVTATLGVALFVLGFAFGPIVFGPLSEALGRRIPLFTGFILFAVFQIPVALAQNITTICVARFIGGFFASAPLSIVGGALSDLWDAVPRSYAICVFAVGGFAGPTVGPIVGGFIVDSSLGWRWTSWITLIMAGVFGIVGLFVIPETSAARILQVRAARLRKQTGDIRYHAKTDLDKLSLKTVMMVYLVRPFKMLVQEPILALMTAYMSYVYGVLYLLFEAYPVSFYEERGWSLSVAQLPFTAFILGIVAGTCLIAYSAATNVTRAFNEHGKAVPEERLPPMIVGAFALPIGLFCFGWTSSPNISWVPSVAATALIGLGCMVPFWQGMSYLIDCYGFYANSAIAVNTFIRSFCGAFFPLFTHEMYTKLGVPWANSVLGVVCVIFLPIPILFYRYGARIRAKSKWTPR